MKDFLDKLFSTFIKTDIDVSINDTGNYIIKFKNDEDGNPVVIDIIKKPTKIN